MNTYTNEVELMLKMSSLVHKECKDAEHDIGIRLFNLVEDYIRNRIDTQTKETDKKLKEVIDAAHKAGWNGVENSKILSEFIIGLKEEIDEKERYIENLENGKRGEEDGILEIRKKYGAKNNETFRMFIERICKERDEYYAKAASLVFHLPKETRCGEIQEWYNDFLKGQKMLANNATIWKEQAERLANALEPFVRYVGNVVQSTRCEIAGKKVYDDFKTILDLSSNNL